MGKIVSLSPDISIGKKKKCVCTCIHSNIHHVNHRSDFMSCILSFHHNVLCFFLSVSAVSTCMSTCKKVAPPPVPPRTTSKPFISVTVQSSTESAQDCYPDHHDRKSEANSQSGRSNSSDSLNSLAKGSRPQLPVAPPREPQIPAAVVISPNPLRESHHEQVKGESLAADKPPVDPVPRRKLSSIGIQVSLLSSGCHTLQYEWILMLQTFFKGVI